MRELDGLMFGDNPRQGFFDGNRFNHPDLQFRIDFPSGWKTQNQAAAVIGANSGGDAVFVLSLQGKDAPSDALGKFLGQQGVTGQGASTGQINGLPAAAAEFQAVTQNQAVAGRVTFVSFGGNTYQLLGYGTPQGYAGARGAITQSTQSFNRLTDQAALNKQPMRINLVRLTRDMTVEEFNRQYPSAVPVATIAMINGAAAPTAVLRSGSWAKRVQ
jgi:predicted Zn-dependent protease